MSLQKHQRVVKKSSKLKPIRLVKIRNINFLTLEMKYAAKNDARKLRGWWREYYLSLSPRTRKTIRQDSKFEIVIV